MKKWIAWMLILCMTLTMAACGGQKAEQKPAEAPAEAPAVQTPPQETEVTFVSDGITLAKVALQEMEKVTSWQADARMEGKGRLGIGAGEHSAELNWETSTAYTGENWSDLNYYHMNVGSKYATVFEEFKILDGKQFYKNINNAAWTVGSGIVPEAETGIPAKQLLEKVVAGQVKADYAASAEEGHSLRLQMSGSELMQLMQEYFPGLVGADGIPETADWNSLQADVTLFFNSYNRYPGKLVMNCPEMLEMLVVSVSDASYLDVEEFEAISTMYYDTNIYVSDDLAMAVPGNIPQPVSFGQLLRQTLAEAGTPITPSRVEPAVPAAPQNVPQTEPVQQQAPVQTEPEKSEPVQQEVPVETQAVSGGFTPPAVFESVRTTDDITLYNDNGAYATVSYPAESAFYKNANFNHGGSYYATIVHDVMSGIGGQTKLTLQDVHSVEDYLDRCKKTMERIIAADQNLVSSNVGDIQTITVDGRTVWYLEATYESVNAFKKPVQADHYYAIAAANGSSICMEFSYTFNPKNGSKRDFNPVELIFSHVK